MVTEVEASSDDSWVATWQLRSRFARALSELYGREVPAYNALVEAASQVNRAVLDHLGSQAQRLGSIERVTAERHGAIRLGTPAELAQAGTIFAAVGMYPVGFYDLRDAAAPIPVISTAFRPLASAELARNPFRIFTSLLALEDERFFDQALKSDIAQFLSRRQLFSPELRELAKRAEGDQGLAPEHARRFLELATGCFALSRRPVERAWYQRLEAVSPVAADIAGVGSTHINHLTPRVLDIDELYTVMTERGIEMISEIQGPPHWNGPPVLLRQTSFRALAEERIFSEPDGSAVSGSLRVRFGEVEQRGIALTPAGRDRYDGLMSRIDDLRASPATVQQSQDAARKIFDDGLPGTEEGLALQDLAFFTYTPRPDLAVDGRRPPASLRTLIIDGWLELTPQVYEDFLPRSAAGIFASNLSQSGAVRESTRAANYDEDWLEGALNRALQDPMDLYEATRLDSLHKALQLLHIHPEALISDDAATATDSNLGVLS